MGCCGLREQPCRLPGHRQQNGGGFIYGTQLLAMTLCTKGVFPFIYSAVGMFPHQSCSNIRKWDSVLQQLHVMTISNAH